MDSKPIYLYVTPYFPSPTSWRGGYCLDMAKALIRSEKYDVRVIAIAKGEDYEWDGVPVARVRRITAPFSLAPFLFTWINKRLLLAKLKRMGISPDKISVCHANTFFCADYCEAVKGLNPKINTLLHHHFSFDLHLRAGRLGTLPIHSTLLYLYYRRLCEYVDAHVFCSNLSRETFGKYFTPTPEGEIQDVKGQLLFGRFMRDVKVARSIVLYNGIDASIFYPIEKTEGEREQDFVIGCVANFQPLKGQLVLIKAVEKLRETIPNIKLRFVGSGEMLSCCKGYVKESRLESIVSFENELDHRALPEFYRSLSLFVLPSRVEAFGCVYIECGACGIPVIGCDSINILKEVIPLKEQDKWLAKPNCSKALAEKILNFYKNRPKQSIPDIFDIDNLTSEFISKLEAL